MSNKPVAIITGASRGIGRAVALNFAKLGYDVALIARNQSKLEQLANEITETYSVDTGVFAIDITDKAEVDEVVQHIINSHKRVDVLFNNAGVLHVGTTEIAVEQFEEMLRVNMLGLFYMTQAVVPQMRQQQSGYIMNLASRAGKIGFSTLGGYVASKFAAVGFNESLFNELASENIKVTALCPSVINTDMTADIQNFPNEEKISVDDIVTTVNYLLNLGPNATIKELVIECNFLTSKTAKALSSR